MVSCQLHTATVPSPWYRIRRSVDAGASVAASKEKNLLFLPRIEQSSVDCRAGRPITVVTTHTYIILVCVYGPNHKE
jgi:hypothetical protein